jgi:uncharacterized protein YjbI with pentapeptide repeats
MVLGSGSTYTVIYATPDLDANDTYTARIIATDNAGNVNDSETHDFNITHADKSIFRSWIDAIWYLANFEWDVSTRTVSNSFINDTIVNGTVIANITNSVLINSVLTDVTVIDYCTAINSVLVGGICDPTEIIDSDTTGSNRSNSHIAYSNATYSNIVNSTIDYSNINNSDITNTTVLSSTIYDSNTIYSNVSDSTLDDSSLSGSNVTDGSVLTDVTADNSNIIDSTLTNVDATNSIVNGMDLVDVAFDGVNITIGDGNLTNMTITNLTGNATFTFNNVTKSINESTPLRYLINFGPTADLHMLADGYAGEAVVLDASGSSDPNIENGINIAWTFNDTLTYTFEIGGDNGYHDVKNETNESFNGIFDGRWSYAFPEGNYTVRVTVTDVFGESITSSPHSINVMVRPSSGGGGGGGTPKCTTNWTCGEWSACANGTQTRNCTKVKPDCNAVGDMPLLKMICTVPLINVPTNITEGNVTGNGTGTSPITGGVIGALNSRMIGALIFIVIMLIAGGILWLARKNHSKANKARKSRRK